jgi:predicted CXXCH cytochrome family protein
VAPSDAAIDGSPHDLVSQGYAQPKTGTPQDVCNPCHIDAVDTDPGLFPEVPPSLRGRYGAAALACFSCHDGITLVALEVDASLTAFHPSSHRGAPSVLLTKQSPEGGSDGADGADGKGAECSSCHDPHENRHRPFLRAQMTALCTSCHAIFSEMPSSQGNRTGSHPVGVDPLKTPSQEAPISIAQSFKVPFPASYPMQMGRGSKGTHWDLGGHLAAGGAGEITCGTCHAVHGDEGAPPATGLLSLDPVRKVADLLCEGCHRGARGDGASKDAAPNPGGTTTGRTYHPCDDDEANGAGRSVQIRTPAGWPFGAGDPPRVICTTCHAAHRMEPGTSLLRPAAAATGFCGECHEQAGSETHHPTGALTGPCATRLASTSGSAGQGFTCDLCHRAHNAGFGTGREPDHVPLLRTGLSGDDLCVACHPGDNPTCSSDPARAASHFLGDPTLPETFADPEPPLRVEPWPESGLKSRYGGENGKEVICLSCHSFKKGALVSGDDGTARFLLARSGNEIEWAPEGEGSYLCTGCHGTSPGAARGEKGHTHPLMTADLAELGNEVSPPLSGTPSGHMNCDSCHRPHGAHTASGVYMLEIVEGLNTDPKAIKPKIAFTPVCHGCHDPGKY